MQLDGIGKSSSKRGGAAFSAAAAAALVLALPSRAAATDIVAVRVGSSFGALPDSVRWDGSLGGSYETNVVPDSIGVRLAGDAVLAGWLSDGPSGNVLGLRPELSFFTGPDHAVVRPYGTLRAAFGVAGWSGADARFLEQFQVGPEVEWRDVTGSGLRIRLAAFYSPGREPAGTWRWGGAALALTFEYGRTTEASVVVPTKCVDLPTRPCP